MGRQHNLVPKKHCYQSTLDQTPGPGVAATYTTYDLHVSACPLHEYLVKQRIPVPIHCLWGHFGTDRQLINHIRQYSTAVDHCKSQRHNVIDRAWKMPKSQGNNRQQSTDNVRHSIGWLNLNLRLQWRMLRIDCFGKTRLALHVPSTHELEINTFKALYKYYISSPNLNLYSSSPTQHCIMLSVAGRPMFPYKHTRTHTRHTLYT